MDVYVRRWLHHCFNYQARKTSGQKIRKPRIIPYRYQTGVIRRQRQLLWASTDYAAV